MEKNEYDPQLRKIGLPQNSAEEFFMDTVKHYSDIGYGRMMQMISLHWYEKDPLGALKTGECYEHRRTKRELSDDKA